MLGSTGPGRRENKQTENQGPNMRRPIQFKLEARYNCRKHYKSPYCNRDVS